MKQVLPSITLAFSLIALSTAQSTFASNNIEDSNKNNHETGIGFGVGSLFGGLIAGPIGVVTGAFIGSLIGQNSASQNEIDDLHSANLTLNNALTINNKAAHSLKESNSQRTLALNDAHQTIEFLLTQNQELKNHALNFDIQFRTNSCDIEKKYHKHLSVFADTLISSPNMEIEIAGFADRVGDEDYNLDLSIKRAVQVKNYFIEQGVEENRIITLAHGENQPLHTKQSLENNFFDRRVSVYLRPIEINSENIAEEIIALEKKLSIAEK